MKYDKEIEQLRQYLSGDISEKSGTHLVYPVFKAVFGNDFLIENEAGGADIYIKGRLVVELKTNEDDWLSGFYQALDYGRRGISFSAVCVIAHDFIGLWKMPNIPEFALQYSKNANMSKPPSGIGVQNARKTNKGQEAELLDSGICFRGADLKGLFSSSGILILREFVSELMNLDSVRQQINPHNFIRKIERLKEIVGNPLEAIHIFYAILNYWDITSVVTEPRESKRECITVAKNGGRRQSEDIKIHPTKQTKFRQFVENHYVFTNEGSGLSVDYYFSRFDEVISKLDPEYVRQHGIFFTDQDLSKFALWFVHHYFEKKLSDNYIVLDPAGGSGNLVMSWRKRLKHKIVSEIESDLLKIIERRMKADNEQIDIGFTIVPKTSLNQGLNFLDKSGEDYLNIIETEMNEKNLEIDKPLVFLLNPPYKNTDENEQYRKSIGANYELDASIKEITGNDAAKERYSAFLAQIVNISMLQVERNPEYKPLLLIFTPTSWLIPRPTYIDFREVFNQYFKFERGFIVKGSEFFNIGGNFPIAFTIWSYNYKENGNKNNVQVYDYTGLAKSDIEFDWLSNLTEINKKAKSAIRGSRKVVFTQKLPTIKTQCGQKMYDFKRSRTKKEKSENIVGGLPLLAPERKNKKTYGTTISICVGFLGNNTPVRIKPKDNDERFDYSSLKSVWFRLDNDFKSVNRTKLLNGPPDKYGYAAFDIRTAKTFFTWFALAKAINGRYPLYYNQHDIWVPQISDTKAALFYSLIFAFGLAENRCVVTKFEADNPVKGAPEVYVDNPLCPTNNDSFWSRVLEPAIDNNAGNATKLILGITDLYEYWGREICQGSRIEYKELHCQKYFKYFGYPDFLTPYSGIIQIKKFAEKNNEGNLNQSIKDIKACTKIVLDEIYGLLVDDFGYFD